MIKKVLLFLYLAAILLLPSAINICGITYAKFIFIITFLVLFVNIYLLHKKKDLKKTLLSFIKSIHFYLCLGIFIFTASVLISTLFNSFYFNQWNSKGFYEILRGFLYIAVIINIFIFSFEDKKIKKFCNIIILSFVFINCVIAVTQYFNPMSINDLYIKYIAPTQYHSLVIPGKLPRVVGLTSNPNVFACLLVLFIPLIYKNILLSGNNIKKMVLYWVLFVFIRIVIYMTSTRSAFILSIMVDGIFCLTCLIYYFKLKKVKSSFLLNIFVVLIIEISMLFFLPDSLTWRIRQMLSFEDMTSWNERIDNSEDMIDEILSDKKPPYINKDDESNIPEDNIPGVNNTENNNDIVSNKTNKTPNFYKNIKLLIGVGPSKATHTTTTGENEWLMIQYKYGIVGVVSFVLIFLLCLKKLNSLSTESIFTYWSLVLTVFVYMIPGGIYHVYNLFIPLLAIFSNNMDGD